MNRKALINATVMARSAAGDGHRRPLCSNRGGAVRYVGILLSLIAGLLYAPRGEESWATVQLGGAILAASAH